MKLRYHIIAATLFLAMILLPVAHDRFIDGDEGYYLYAARIVSEGSVPYRDFLYTQMPLLPYVYGSVFKLTGPGWYPARYLTAALTLGLGLLIFIYLARKHNNRIWAWFGLFLFTLSGLGLAWFVTAKTYALSSLLLFISFLGLHLARNVNRRGTVMLFFCGLTFGLAIAARLTIAAVAPLFLIMLMRDGWILQGRLRRIFAFACGGAMASLVPFYLLIQDPSNFIFGNWSYHQIRSGLSQSESLAQKWETFFSIFSTLGEGTLALAAQAGVLLFFITISAVFSVRAGSCPSAVLAIICILGAVSLAPSPSYLQYFCLLIPYAVIEAVEGARALFVSLNQRSSPAAIGPGIIVSLILIYGVAGGDEMRRICKTGEGVVPTTPGSGKRAWTINYVRETSKNIDTRVPPGDEILTWWPGYCLETVSHVAYGLENHFGQEIAERQTITENAERHTRSAKDIERMIRSRDYPLVIIGNWTGGWKRHLRPFYVKSLSQAGYENSANLWECSFFELRIPDRPS